tara:strand:+ start:4159 stop:4440 length:282 start_codon:yes stop_codon:yes gene_type:complete
MKLNDFKDVMNKSFGSRHENIPAEDSIINNEQDTREYMEKYTTTEPQQKLDRNTIIVTALANYYDYNDLSQEEGREVIRIIQDIQKNNRLKNK